MALEVEHSPRMNVTQGLLNLTHGFNNILSPKSSATSIRLEPMRSSSASEAIQGSGSLATEADQQHSQKTPRKWTGFSKEKRSPKTGNQSVSPSPSPNPFFSMSPTKPQPRCEYNPGSNAPDRERAWPRRKGSIPDLLMKAMTTVQENQMDSPTIPGCPPIPRSFGISPGNNSPRTPELSETGSLTPRAFTSLQVMRRPEGEGRSNSENQEGENGERRKSSSRNVPHLLILTNDQSLLPAKAYRRSEFNDNDGPPPQVPPKSPRTMNKTFSHSGKVLPSSVNSSTSTLHSISTSMTSVGTLEDVTNCIPWSAPIRTESQDVYHSGFGGASDILSPPPRSAKELRTSPSRQFQGGATPINDIPLTRPGTPITKPSTPIPKPSTPSSKASGPKKKHGSPKTKAGSPTSKPSTPTTKSVPPTAKPESPQTKLTTPTAKPESPITRPGTPAKRPGPPTSKYTTALKSEESSKLGASGGHQGRGLETSVMSRGHPTRRGAASLQRKQPQVGEIENEIDDTYDDLLAGVSNAKALNAIPFQEIRRLKKQAEGAAKTFNILRESQVLHLSEELAILDERCEYLRRTYISLRAGRRGLQSRIVEYLNSPRTATFSMDNIVKQEDALAELDISIDEWNIKLERAQDRRNAVRQKLLEHSAAVLMFKLPSLRRNETSDERRDTQTPPQSPTKADGSFSVERRDVESIRVYADSGVASLLVSIEQDLEKMEEQGLFELP